MGKRVIFHIDVNQRFPFLGSGIPSEASGWELDLRTIPSAVGGDISKRHGIILAKSIPAKKYTSRRENP